MVSNEYAQLVVNINKLNQYCFICGSTENVTGHHIRKATLGHKDYTDPDNLVILCEHHHKDYHNTYNDVCPKTFAEYVKHEKEKEYRRTINENKILKNELQKIKNKQVMECEKDMTETNIYNELIDAFANHEFIIQKIKTEIKEIIQADKSYTRVSNPNQKNQEIDIDIKEDIIKIYLKPSISNHTISLIDEFLGFHGIIEAVNRNGKKLWLCITYEKTTDTE